MKLNTLTPNFFEALVFYGGGGGGSQGGPPIYQLSGMGTADYNTQAGIANIQQNPQLQNIYNQAQGSLGYIPASPSGYNPQQIVQSGQNIQGAAAQLPQSSTNVYSAIQGMPGMASDVSAASQGLPYMAQQIYQTGFDPQNALFNQLQQQVADQTGSIEAMQGLGGTPYAAGLEAQNLANFDTAWQNNLLNRETQAGQSANQLLQGYAGDQTAAGGILGQYGQGALQSGQLAQQYGQLLAQGADVMAQAPQMQSMISNALQSMASMPIQQQQQAVADQLQYLSTGNQAESVGVQAQGVANQAAQAQAAQMMQGLGMMGSMLGGMKGGG